MAERLLPLLTDEPQAMVRLGEQLGLPKGAKDSHAEGVGAGLSVLEARGLAKRIGRRGWVRGDAKVEGEAPVVPAHLKFPYKLAVLALAGMFVDASYQRPVTTFVEEIQANFDPVLFGALVVSDRGRDNKQGRYAVVDGQTRWLAARRIGIREAHAIVFSGITPADEARIFADLQRKRRGMTSWHRFRAQLAAGDKESQEILAYARSAGYEIGDRPGELHAVAALEYCYRKDAFLFERTLIDMRAAFGDKIPSAAHIRGLHFWFRNPGQRFRKKDADVDDERLVRRLSVAGLDGLNRKALAAKEMSTTTTVHEQTMAIAIDSVYASR